MMKGLGGLAFRIGVLALAVLAVWLSLEPIQYLQMAAAAQHLEWRGLANIAPLALAVLAVMFIAPAAWRQASDGKGRQAWTLLTLGCALALGLAFPARWLTWMLSADF
jgi:hypothetical protein